MALHNLLPAAAQNDAHIYFANYPYGEWKPPLQRKAFVAQYARGESLLDIGCGAYPVSEEINVRYKAGMDISVAVTERAMQCFNAFYLVDISQIADAVLTSLGTFDTIIASELLEHLSDPQAAVKKMKALLSPHGKLLVTVPNGYSLAASVDKALHKGHFERFRVFHWSHVSLLPKTGWEKIFKDEQLAIEHFDFRPTDLIEGFPREHASGWKLFCSFAPHYLAHQFFYVLRHE